MKIGQITKPRTGSPRGGKFRRKKIAEKNVLLRFIIPRILGSFTIARDRGKLANRSISPRIAASRNGGGIRRRRRKKKKFMIIMVMSREREANQPTVSLACCQPMYNVLVRLGGRKFTVTNGSPVALAMFLNL